MRTFFVTLSVAMLVNGTDAHKLNSVGIFDKLYKEEADAQQLAQSKAESIAYKKKQLEEAEKEHEKAVKEEEEEDRIKEEKDSKDFEERALLKRNEEAEERRK